MSLRLAADPTWASSKPWRTLAEADAREASLPWGFAGRAAAELEPPVCSTQLSEPAVPLPTATSRWVGSVWDRDGSCPPAAHHTDPAPSAPAESGPSKPPNKGHLALVSTDHPFLALTEGQPAPLGTHGCTTPVVGAALTSPYPGGDKVSVTCDGILPCSPGSIRH